MNNKYINIYNNLVNLTRNKDLYVGFTNEDTFSDRLIFFLLHFAFFLKIYKNKDNKRLLQDIYDNTFRQLELGIREIGYGDQSINKKMKDYINYFYSIIDKIDNWEDLTVSEKITILKSFIDVSVNISYLVDYFDKYRLNLINNTLNSHIKGVIKIKN
jgi:cytochrome b pre-mRNA-processing protein 3